MQTVTPLLMFEGKAEEAMNYYISLFADSKIINVTRYKSGEGGTEGQVMHAAFSLNHQTFMCIDSPVKHSFGFTAAISIYVNNDSEIEIDTLYSALSNNGQVLMPLSTYPFSKRYGWVTDKFGVSWQLNYNK